MQNPFISIIIPMYNSEKTIRECLGHVYNSDYKNFEVIVVDDGSTDNSTKIASKFPCKLIKLKKNKGWSIARNTGAQEAKGEILVFIDSDILIKKRTLNQILASFNEKLNVSLVVGVISKENKYSNFSSQYKTLRLHYSYMQMPKHISMTSCQITAIKRGVFEKSGCFDKEYDGVEDTELGQRLTTRGHKIYLNKKIQVMHNQKYSFLGLLKKDFKRAILWTKLLLRGERWENIVKERRFGYESINTAFSIVAVYFTIILFFLSVMYRQITYWVLVILLISTFLLLNLKFFRFLRKEGGLVFWMRSILMTIIYMLVVGQGIFIGVLRNIFTLKI